MDWFCSEEERSALESREKRLAAAFRILASVALIVFIVLCMLVRTENAQAMHGLLVVSATLPGWICIILWQSGVKESRTQLAHLNMLLEGEKEYREGRITLTGESVQIPKSIRIRKVLLDTGGEDPVRLNLDEKWIPRMPPDGSLVRLALVHSYIAGAETLEKAVPENSGTRRPAGVRKAAKLVPLLGIWVIAAAIFSSFVFYRITDTDPARKITIWVDGTIHNEAQLAAKLEKDLADPIRMVQIHPFSYAMFGSAALKAADLFIVPDSEKEQFSDWFAPGEEGIPVSGPEAETAAAASWFLYNPGETYRLYLGAGSSHLEDGLARKTAQLLLSLKTE